MSVFSLCSMVTGCSTPAAPRTSLTLFPSYSKLPWLSTHRGVIPKEKTSPELVAFGFLKSWQPCFRSSWVLPQRAGHKTSCWSHPMRKVLASREMLCEECLRAQKKKSKVKGNNKINPRKKLLFFLGCKGCIFWVPVMEIRWGIFRFECLCPFSLDFWELLSS